MNYSLKNELLTNKQKPPRFYVLILTNKPILTTKPQ